MIKFVEKKFLKQLDDFIYYYDRRAPADVIEDKYTKDTLVKYCEELRETERKFYMALLITHFDSSDIAKDFYHKFLPYEDFISKDYSWIEKQLLFFFTTVTLRNSAENPYMYYIGGHRKYFRALNTIEKKVKYTLDMFKAYRDSINKYGSQSKMFGLSHHKKTGEEGYTLYNKIRERMFPITNLNSRLNILDHLERVNRVFGYYMLPERMFVEGAQDGAFDGVNYLVFGIRFRKLSNKKKNKYKEYFNSGIVKDWNEFVPEKYEMKDSMTFTEKFIQIDKFLVFIVLLQLLRVKSKDLYLFDEQGRSYIWDLEGRLCIWQKGK